MNKTICSEIEWQRNYEKHIERLSNKESYVKTSLPIRRKLSMFADYTRKQKQIEINRENLKLLKRFIDIARTTTPFGFIGSPISFNKKKRPMSSLNSRVRSAALHKMIEENSWIDTRLKNTKSIYSNEKYKKEYKNHRLLIKSISNNSME